MTSTPPGGGPERPGHELQRALYEMFNGPADEGRIPAEDEQVRDDPAVAEAPEPEPTPEPDDSPLLAAFATAEVHPEPEADPEPEPEPHVDIEDVPAPVAELPGPDLYADPDPIGLPDEDAEPTEQYTEPTEPASTRSRRRWIPAAVVAAALTAVAGAGLFLDLGAEDDPRAGSGGGAGESQPADDPSDGSPPVEIADFLASSDVMYGDVAAAVTSADDVAALVEAAQVAADAQSEAADLVATSATLDPLPAPTESDVLARRSDFIAAVAGFTALETGTLANFGELATTLGTSADELDRAEVTLDLATTETDQAADQTADRTASVPLVLAAAQEPADGETAAATVAAHLTGVVGAEAVETATADALDLVGQLELAEVTADVRAAAGDAAGVAAYVSAAAAGFPDDSTTAGQLAALTELLTPIGQLTAIDGESLRTWDSVGPTLAEAATSLDGLLAASTQAAHGHLDDLVGSARATIAAWEAEVAQAQRSGGGSDAGLETYAAAVAAHLETYDELIAQLPQLSGEAQPSSSQGVALYRLARSFESLQADVATVVAPGAMTNAHASVVALVDAGTQAAVQGEAASRSAEACRGAGRSSAECRLGAQPQWSQYSGAVGTARTNGSVASGWQAALEAARASTGRVDAPPRPVV